MKRLFFSHFMDERLRNRNLVICPSHIISKAGSFDSRENTVHHGAILPPTQSGYC